MTRRGSAKVSVPVEVFRHVLGHLAGGVAVVTSRGSEGEPSGLTATAVCSVSLDPPLVLVCVESDSNTHEAIRASRAYAINLLSRADETLADRFSHGRPGKFAGLAFASDVTGSPILEGVTAYCDCTVKREVAAGDHTVFIGLVESARVQRSGEPEPLVRYLGRYATVARSAETRGHGPETPGHGPEAPGHGPETRGHGPETPGQEPEVREP
ncbi:MAG: flavin reductase family protein [Gemmatimonadota bacterium]